MSPSATTIFAQNENSISISQEVFQMPQDTGKMWFDGDRESGEVQCMKCSEDGRLE